MAENEIKCPNCGKTFKVDESSFASIVRQVRDHEFEKDLKNRIHTLQETHEKDVALAEEKIRAHAAAEYLKLKSEKEAEISSLQSKLDNASTKQKLAVSDAVSKVEKERDELKNLIKLAEAENKSKEVILKEKYENSLKLKDEQIAELKDFKARQSTKMVGESLEQHCENEFNKLRATGFQHAYFEKDNTVSKSGSKGDFIYRETDENGVEIISIMFEMKNENETTATKHKNEDFFKELDKDRTEKNCEYAVLVTLLEADSELYNTGIVDVSHKFPKMYVVRPQFFIPIITILRNAALNSMQYKTELAIAKNQNLDITRFEENIEAFKSGFARNYELASRKFQTAIDEIDKTIEHLQKTKENLLRSEDNLRLASNKAEEQLTVKRLTKNAPSVAAEFDKLKNPS